MQNKNESNTRHIIIIIYTLTKWEINKNVLKNEGKCGSTNICWVTGHR